MRLRSTPFTYLAGISALLLMAAVPAFGQKPGGHAHKPALKFESDTWNFGIVKEADGPVSHTFTFTNTFSGPIIIERVTTDCGCTAPRYSSEPVRPGRTGTIEIVFDPTNYRGEFTKTASVFCNNGRSRNDLTLTGRVIERERSAEELYPYLLAEGVRADNLRLAFDYMNNDDAKSMVINFINTSDKKVSLSVRSIDGSGYLTAYVPPYLSPGERGTGTFTYDLSATPQPVYGMISDIVSFAVNGRVPEMTVSAHAVAVEDFSGMDPRYIPSCYINPVFHNFGKIGTRETVSREIVISNTGTGPLIIRSVTPRANTQSDLAAGTEIAPGKSHRFTVSMKLQGGGGVKTGGITLVTNDPDRPLRDIRLAAEAEK